jgi:hypothetical protein
VIAIQGDKVVDDDFPRGSAFLLWLLFAAGDVLPDVALEVVYQRRGPKNFSNRAVSLQWNTQGAMTEDLAG